MARKMKDSGIAWIGEIPEEWKVVPLKYLCTNSITDGTHKTPTYTDKKSGIPFLSSKDITKGKIDWLHIKYITKELHKQLQKEVKPQRDDILLAKNGTTGIAALVEDDTIFDIYVTLADIRPDKNQILPKYMLYCINSELCKLQFDWHLLGIGVPNLHLNVIKETKLTTPPLDEQHRIAAFLDEKCAHIDAVIEKTRASIDEYKKLKHAIITRAVTKGLRKGRKMKDSGIEWIGEIPQEWEARRIKTLFQLRDERNSLPLEQVNLISLYTDKGVMQHSDIEKTTGNKASHADGYKKVYQNDIVVNIILCWMGAIGRSDYDGVTSPAYDVYIPSEEIDSRFYHHYFRTSGFSGDCYKRGKGIMAMRWRTYSDQFRDIRVVMPPLPEQREILAYLDAKTAAIDRLIAKKEQLIAEMQSCKKSLIYEVVTGKREVPI